MWTESDIRSQNEAFQAEFLSDFTGISFYSPIWWTDRKWIDINEGRRSQSRVGAEDEILSPPDILQASKIDTNIKIKTGKP